uniref:Uncharacterized protein n=1 Tax=Arundo donax TaxID=35708 RepID=A0A0A8XQW2_ARUDO
MGTAVMDELISHPFHQSVQ